MKKCPICDSVNKDQDYICGVCGGDLAGAIPVDETSLDQPVAQAVTVEPRRLEKEALLLIMAGPALSLVGLVLALNLLNLSSEAGGTVGVRDSRPGSSHLNGRNRVGPLISPLGPV